jgi:secondary thiamine-phosphate synthase enzyme
MATPGDLAMSVVSVKKSLKSRGNNHVIDITSQVAGSVAEAGIESGIATIFVTGSTAGVTTVEFEPGLVQDLDTAFNRLMPRELDYRHHERWGDDNGHSHVRASLLGPSLTIPFQRGQLALGTWQQIVLIDFDTRPRNREYVIQIIG